MTARPQSLTPFSTMTERERWVVYPLLFLALGAALRDKLVDRTTTKSIRCQELVVEEEPTSSHPGRVLAKIGRTESTATTPAIGYFLIKGEVNVDGLVKVDGIVNAKQYAYQGLLFMPLWQPTPGVTMPNLVRPPQSSGQGRPNPNTPNIQSPGQPPATGSKKSGTTAPPSSPADDEPQSAK